MYVRSKIVKGQTYYQIVEGVRDGAKVRQRIVVSLGRTPDLAAALARLKRTLTNLRRERTSRKPQEGESVSARRLERLDRLDRHIADLEANVETLSRIIKDKLIRTVGTTPKEGD